METLGNVFRVVNVMLSIGYMLIILVRTLDRDPGRSLEAGLALYLRGVGAVMASAVLGSWLSRGQPFRISQPLYTLGLLIMTYASLRRHAVSGDDSASHRGRGTNA